MTKRAKAVGFIVVLRAERATTDDQATRALRAFLKNALRAYGLRCVSAEPEPTDGEAEKEKQEGVS